MKNGIDVSHWQGKINWTKVKAAGVDFAIIKIGGDCPSTPRWDNTFTANIEDALAAGLGVGVYLYAKDMTPAQAKQSADAVIAKLAQYKGKLAYPVAYDVEDAKTVLTLSKALLTDVIVAFCERIKSAGYIPALYMSASPAKTAIDLSKLPYDLWIARYNKGRTLTDPPMNCDIYQYSDQGCVDGISGHVDLDVCYKEYKI